MKKLFNDPDLPEWLDAEADYDRLSFGVVKMDYNGIVTGMSRPKNILQFLMLVLTYFYKLL